MKLYRVECDHFVAGFITENNIVIKTAPIIKCTKGWCDLQAIEYFGANGCFVYYIKGKFVRRLK